MRALPAQLSSEVFSIGMARVGAISVKPSGTWTGRPSQSTSERRLALFGEMSFSPRPMRSARATPHGLSVMNMSAPPSTTG